MAEIDNGVTQTVIAATLLARRAHMLMTTSGDTLGLASVEVVIDALRDVTDLRTLAPYETRA